MTTGRKLAFAGGLSAAVLLVVGLGAAGAIAASRILSPNDESKAVIDDAAAQLGVKPQALSAALKQALENRIDAAVADGRLTKEQGVELEKRLESNDYPLLFGGGRPDGPFGHGFGAGPDDHFGILDAAASYLGVSEDALRTALDGKTLAQVAKDHGKSVSGLVGALVAAEDKRIDEAVSSGRLTKDQATALKAGLQDRMQALVDGKRPDRDDFHGRSGFRPWSGSPRAPPALFGGGGPRA
jgi:uncharacterized protein YidB (DUF937 family)